MRWATVRHGGQTRAATVRGDRLQFLGQSDVGALLLDAVGTGADPTTHMSLPGRAGREAGLALDQADLAPLVPRPAKIICLGHNYRSHVRELGVAEPCHPTLFAKFAPCLIGARDPIVLPSASQRADWEVELGVVVGRHVRHASPAVARDAIAGYTVVNDVSIRDFQHRTTQWLQGKTFERTTPIGPVLVSPDEVDHARDLLLRCEVDGVVVQEGRTSDLLFPPAETVAYISAILPLEPGDVISTGTPSGVGDARQPPMYLQPGQTVRTSIEGIGELVNLCVAESEARRSSDCR